MSPSYDDRQKMLNIDKRLLMTHVTTQWWQVLPGCQHRCEHSLLPSVSQALRCSVHVRKVELGISSCFVVFSAGFWTQRLVYDGPMLSCVHKPCKVIFCAHIKKKISGLVHRSSQVSASSQISQSGILQHSILSGEGYHRMWYLRFCADRHFSHTCSTDDKPFPWRSPGVGALTLFLGHRE